MGQEQGDMMVGYAQGDRAAFPAREIRLMEAPAGIWACNGHIGLLGYPLEDEDWDVLAFDLMARWRNPQAEWELGLGLGSGLADDPPTEDDLYDPAMYEESPRLPATLFITDIPSGKLANEGVTEAVLSRLVEDLDGPVREYEEGRLDWKGLADIVGERALRNESLLPSVAVGDGAAHRHP